MKILITISISVIIMCYIVAQPIYRPITTVASWYGGKADGLVGKLTASGEPLNDKALTCAFWGFPFGTKIKVTLVGSNRSVICRVNDRGPNRKKYPERGIDLTKAAFSRLAHPSAGLITVKLEVVK